MSHLTQSKYILVAVKFFFQLAVILESISIPQRMLGTLRWVIMLTLAVGFLLQRLFNNAIKFTEIIQHLIIKGLGKVKRRRWTGQGSQWSPISFPDQWQSKEHVWLVGYLGFDPQLCQHHQGPTSKMGQKWSNPQQHQRQWCLPSAWESHTLVQSCSSVSKGGMWIHSSTPSLAASVR